MPALASTAAASSVLTPAGQRRRTGPRRGSVTVGGPPGALAALGGQLAYNVYANAGAGDPIDYATPIGTVNTPGRTTAGLTPGTWRFGVRAVDGQGEEQNLDCSVVIVIDANGNDITNLPAPPTGLRAFPTSAGGMRVEWFYPPVAGPTAPAGFNVYCTAGAGVSYAAPTATVAANTGLLNTFVCNLSGLSGGTSYAIGVRACNATGEEPNTYSVAATALAAGPAAVDSLVAAAIV